MEGDNIALEEKRRIAEEKRKKRANFLSNVGEFSETFSSDASKQTNQSEASSGGVQIPSSKYTSQVSKVKEQNDLEELKSLKSPVKSPNPKSQFMDESLSKSVANISISSSTISDSAGNDLGLAVPSRIGGMKATSKNDVHKASPNKVEIKSSFSPSSKTTGYESNDDDDDEEDYSSNLMSGSQKGQTQSKEDTSIESASESATWKAMQNDLTNKRKDFYGSVAYAFDGVFSWEMYGSAEAIDENGKEYTEYLMRCQWGTTWDNMQPWISARRFREFDRLDYDLRRSFPELVPTMPKLAEKDYFRFLEADVIAKRRKSIENYMNIVITTIPKMLSSTVMDKFLGISERIDQIKLHLRNENDKLIQQGIKVEKPFLPPGVVRELKRDGTEVSSTDTYASEELTILSSEDADEFRIKNKVSSMDEDQLGQLEEDIHKLIKILVKAQPRDLGRGTVARKLMTSCTNRWPNLRVICDLNSEFVNFALVPRAMQAEEDLVRCVSDFRSLVALTAKR